jgi:hypothetical protein
MFFTEQRVHFFRPLIGKYREQVLECLRAFYARLYSSAADYSRSCNRDQVIEVFQEAITRTPLLEEEGEELYAAPVRREREQAGWVLNQLLDYGWLERQVDEATLQSSYAFTRHGRLFTQPMVEAAGGRFRTRHRNTRNTRNALESFLEKGEIYDLLDAFEYSERIIADFSDVIAELDERKRQLVKEVEAQQVIQRASDEFFDFMEKRFMPDLAVRLSADSVEKYRDQIAELVAKCRRKRKEFKTDAERELRRAAPELIEAQNKSVYFAILDGIESRVYSASAIMLPALRHALNSFTRRADIIMRQLSYAGVGQQNRLHAVCKDLKALPDQEKSAALEAAGEALASLNVGLPDPDSLRLHAGRRQRVVNTSLEAPDLADPESRKSMFIQTAVDLAFTFSSQKQREYVIHALADGQRIESHRLPVNNARDLLMKAHAIELGSAGSSEYAFKIEPVQLPDDERPGTEYFEKTDVFTIQLVEKTGP